MYVDSIPLIYSTAILDLKPIDPKVIYKISTDFRAGNFKMPKNYYHKKPPVKYNQPAQKKC